MNNRKKHKIIIYLFIGLVLMLISTYFAYKVYAADATVTVTFNANGGTGTMGKQAIEKNKDVLINSNKFTAPTTSKAFFGWNTTADGTGTYYAEQDAISITKNTTLYAQWKTVNESSITTAGGTISTGYYKLTKNITISSYIGITANNIVVIDLNGYVLKLADTAESVVVRNRGTLTIKDSRPNAKHYGKVDENNIWTWDSSKEGTSSTPSGYIRITGGIITGGHPTSGTTGAGVLNYGNASTKAIAKLVTNGGNIVGNYNMTTSGAGAGIRSHTGGTSETNGYNPYCTLICNNTRIAYNYHKLNGGGIYASGDSMITGCTVDNNKANSRGGGIRITSQYDTNITITDSSFTNNIAGSDGGAINISIGTTDSESHATQAIISNVKNTVISNNISSGNGGGIAMYDDPGVDVILNINEGTVIEGNNSQNGSGIYMGYGNINMNAGEIYSNTASDVGGGVYLSQGIFTMNSGNIGKDGGVNTATLGGGIYISNGNAIIRGGIIEKNEADNNGGGIYIAGGTLDMSAGTFKSNKAQNGGAAYVSEGDVIINGGNIQNCQATNGGGIYISNGDITMNGGNISNNEVTTNGGAVCVNGGDFTMNGGVISNNNSIDGGAVYITGGNFLMTSGELTYNTASNEGGAVYANGGSIVIGIEDCTEENNLHESPKTHPIVTENTAVYGGGGFMTDGTLTMYCGTIRGNASNNDGTGNNIYMNGGSFELAGGSVGEETNPGIVLVGGELNDSREDDTTQGEEIIMIYHSCLDGVAEHKVNVTEGKYVNLPAAQTGWAKEGHTMVGWTTIENAEVRAFDDYKSVGMAVKVDDTDGNGEIHYYAVWVKTTSTITYNLDGGTLTGTNAISYNYSVISETLQLISPQRQYYKFVGWSLTASEETKTNWETYYPQGEKSVFYSVEDAESGLDLNIGTHFGDITLTAVYEIILKDIQININNSMAKNQSYILNITGTPSIGNEFKPLKIATITDENGSSSVLVKGVPLGTYTVELQGNWSWRYSLSENNIQTTTNIKIEESQETHIVNFEEFSIKNSFWLNAYN